MKSFLSSFPRNQKVSLLLLGATHICYACMYVCMHTDTCGLTDSSMLCLWISIFFSTGCPQNKLKQKNYLPQRQIMSLAEKADTAAVSFCLNSIFFSNSAHGKSSLSPLDNKGLCTSKSSSCLYSAHLYLPPWEIRISFCPSSVISEKAVLTPNSQNQTLQSKTQGTPELVPGAG